MPDPQSAPAGDGSVPVKPVIPTGQEIFDMIMGEIEPDLISANVGGLEEKYKAEPEDKKKERLARYQKAFEEYDKKYKVYMDDLTKKVNDYLKAEMKRIEAENKEKEKNVLNNLEASILSS